MRRRPTPIGSLLRDKPTVTPATSCQPVGRTKPMLGTTYASFGLHETTTYGRVNAAAPRTPAFRNGLACSAADSSTPTLVNTWARPLGGSTANVMNGSYSIRPS